MLYAVSEMKSEEREAYIATGVLFGVAAVALVVLGAAFGGGDAEPAALIARLLGASMAAIGAYCVWEVVRSGPA